MLPGVIEKASNLTTVGSSNGKLDVAARSAASDELASVVSAPGIGWDMRRLKHLLDLPDSGTLKGNGTPRFSRCC